MKKNKRISNKRQGKARGRFPWKFDISGCSCSRDNISIGRDEGNLVCGRLQNLSKEILDDIQVCCKNVLGGKEDRILCGEMPGLKEALTGTGFQEGGTKNVNSAFLNFSKIQRTMIFLLSSHILAPMICRF